MKHLGLVAALLLALTVAACESQGRGTKQTIGGLSGAALGGLLGAQFGSGTGQLATTAAGVLIGALVGSDIGRTMDDVDRLKADQAVNRSHTATLGETIAWNNPQSGNSGTITPVRDGTSTSGRYCREFQQTVVIGGKTEQGYGIACREPDGAWRLLEQ